MVGEVFGQYRILEPIGSGAMSSVYRAEDLSQSRQVAIKVLADKYLHDREALSRFEREGRACRSLEHPNICAVYDTGRWQGRPFLVMELLTGTTLADRMKGGRIRPEGVAVIGIPVLNALDAAHAKGILHRDIKPANLFLTKGGQVKVLDFGLAKVRTGWGAASSGAGAESMATVVTFVTMPGTLLGTLGYMAPEQVRGESLDGRADLYSFGVVMFEALTGALPIRGGGQAPLPGPLGPFIARLIEPDRTARFASAAEARDALAALRLAI
jgi:serine/threonine protein kinase